MDINWALVVEALKAVAWPIAAMYALRLCQRHVLPLVEGRRLKALKSTVLELSFDAAAEKLQHAIAPLPSPDSSARARLTDVQLDPIERSVSDYHAAVTEAWNRVHQAVSTALAQLRYPPMGLKKAATFLGEEGVLKPGTVSAIASLRRVGEAASETNDPISAEKAEQVLGAAQRICEAIVAEVSEYWAVKKAAQDASKDANPAGLGWAERSEHKQDWTDDDVATAMGPSR